MNPYSETLQTELNVLVARKAPLLAALFLNDTQGHVRRVDRANFVKIDDRMEGLPTVVELTQGGQPYWMQVKETPDEIQNMLKGIPTETMRREWRMGIFNLHGECAPDGRIAGSLGTIRRQAVSSLVEAHTEIMAVLTERFDAVEGAIRSLNNQRNQRGSLARTWAALSLVDYSEVKRLDALMEALSGLHTAMLKEGAEFDQKRQTEDKIFDLHSASLKNIHDAVTKPEYMEREMAGLEEAYRFVMSNWEKFSLRPSAACVAERSTPGLDASRYPGIVWDYAETVPPDSSRFITVALAGKQVLTGTPFPENTDIRENLRRHRQQEWFETQIREHHPGLRDIQWLPEPRY